MARTLGNNDEERERRIKLVVDYIINDNCSIREVQKRLKDEHGINISIATISTYAKKVKEETRKQIEGIYCEHDSNKLKHSTGEINEEVKERVLKCYKLYYEENLTIKQIADLCNLSVWVVYRDLIRKLPMIDKEKYQEVIKKIYEARMSNLKNNKKK